MEYHEYANLFPMLPDLELGTLAADIAENGLQTPIVTYEGKILDGRNRYRACEIAGVDPTLEEYQGGDPVGFVISHNLHRRHLTESQRAMVGAKWAKLKKGVFHGNQHTSSPPIGEHQTESKTRDEAAKILSIGTGSIDRAKQVINKGSQELVDLVENGKVSVDSARLIVRLDQEEQREVMAKGVDAIKAKASELRGKAKAYSQEEPEPLVVDGTKEDERKTMRVPKWTPDDAERLWLLAKTDLDKILPSDKSRERVLREVIAYAQNRIDKNK
jgi:hypothetical protein